MTESGLLCRFPARALFLEESPHVAVDHVGAVNAGQDADDDGQREFPDGSHAQDAQRHDGDQGGEGCADGAAQTLLDGNVRNLFLRSGGHLLVILTDPVEDHDGVVDGVTDDGQGSGDERGVHLDEAAEDDHEGQHHEHVVQQAEHSGKTGVEVKPDGDVDQHQHGGQQHGYDGVLDQRGAGDRTNVVHVADGDGVRILFLQAGFKIGLNLLDIVLGNVLDADIDFVVVRALHGDCVTGDIHTVQHGFDVRLVRGGLQIVLHG